MTRRILITGANGQIGRALIESANVNDIILAPNSADLDISSQQSVANYFDHVSPDIVINTAAFTHVDGAESDEKRAFAVNAQGPSHIAKACCDLDAILLHLSTDYVFDGIQKRPYREDDTPNPINVYGASKLAGERAISNALRQAIILRVSWVFSPVGRNFLKTMLNLAERNELSIVNDQYGTPCAAADIARCIWHIVDRLNKSSQFGIYHYSTKPETTWCGFAQEIFAEYSRINTISAPNIIPVNTDEYPTDATRPQYSILDSSKLQQTFACSVPDWREQMKSIIHHLSSTKSS